MGWKSSNFIYITHDDVPVECDRLCSDDNDTKNTTKMPNEEALGPRKTMFVLVIVVGCFAVLWPKILSPLILGGTREQLKPNAYDREAGNVGIFNFNLNVNIAGRRVLRVHLRALSSISIKLNALNCLIFILSYECTQCSMVLARKLSV